MGVKSNGRALGTLGDVGIFSLGRGKNITCGSGGIVVTKSERIAEAIGREWRRLESPSVAEGLKGFAQLFLMTIFIRPGLYWIPAALPFLRLGQTIFPKDVTLKRLSGMHAGLLRNWRSRLRQSNRTRSRTATYFSERLSLTLADGPSHPYVRLPLFAATPRDRDRIHSLSEQRGLGLSLAYPTPINEIPEISRMFEGKHFPSARRVAEHILTIPTHHWLSEQDKRAIAECIETGRGACTAGTRTSVSSALPRKPEVGGRRAAAPIP
jgi:perosamine synthetase